MVGVAGELWSPEEFLEELKAIPWFRNIGRSTAADAGLKRIHRWKDWPGPNDPAVSELSFRQQDLHDAILAKGADNRAEMVVLWDRVHAVVLELAAAVVPYDPKQDSWHAPTMAAWQAAWTAGLVGLFQQSGRPIPTDLQEQWNWFVRGHWPCGYAHKPTDTDRAPPLCVY